MSLALLLFLAIFAGVVLFRYRSQRPRSADFEAIQDYMQSRQLRTVSIEQPNNHWRYWLRGKLRLSNLARTFVVVAENADGARREIHIAFDPWRESGALQVLQDKELPD
jgi:hypothetical protein